MNPIIKQIRNYFTGISQAQRNLLAWYILSLILPTTKHSLSWAAKVSKRSKSSFSRLLMSLNKKSSDILSSLLTEMIPNMRRPILNGAPWTVALIIDSTIYNRASRKTQNSQKFNHGKGFESGHQFTNIVLLINGQIFPMPPIVFYTKGYCRKHGLVYETENEALLKYFSELDLTSWLGFHRNSEILVLSDSGYDDRRIYKACLSRGWEFIGSLRSSSKADLEHPLKNGPMRVDQLFKLTDGKLWKTVYTYLNGESRKRKDFRACALQAFLSGLCDPIQLVCSEPRQERRKKRKYLVCSNWKVDVGLIVRAYRLRWSIEVFHKEVKSHLGFQDGSLHAIDRIEVHVHMVYVSYLLLNKLAPNARGVQESCHTVADDFYRQPFRDILSVSGRFEALKSIRTQCFEELQAS